MRTLQVPPGAGGVSHFIRVCYYLFMNKENRFNGEVSYLHRNILQIDNRSLETVDMLPEDLEEIIELFGDDFRLHMPEITAHNEQDRPTTSRFLRPVILIARLALINQPYNALTRQALISRQRHIVHDALLTDEALPYWMSVARTDFQPQVHVLEGHVPAISGVWLGISEK